MATIAVSIDNSGNITCPDTNATVGEQVTWSVRGGTISSITPGNPSPFSSSPESKNGQWSATVIGGGTYTLGDPQGKSKSPRISVIAPMAEKY